MKRHRIKKCKFNQFRKKHKDKVINTVNINDNFIDCYVFPGKQKMEAAK